MRRPLRSIPSLALLAALTACGKPAAKAPASAADAAAPAPTPAPAAAPAADAAPTPNPAGASPPGENPAPPAQRTPEEQAALEAKAAEAIRALADAQAKLDVQRGGVLYAKLCALCHGPERKGYAADNAPSLVSPTFLESADDAFLASSIAKGRPGTAMAAYSAAVGGPLQPADIRALVRFLRAGAPDIAALDQRIPAGDAVEGGKIFDAQCASCHGSPTQRRTAVHLFNRQFLTDASDAYLRHAIENGRPGTPMVAYGEKLQPKDIEHLVTYLRSMAKPPASPPPMPEGLPPTPPRTGPIVINPKGKPARFTKLREGRYAPIDEVAKALKEGRRIVFADARAPSDWAMMHIEGAISTPYYDTKTLDDIPNDGTAVIAYCACPHHASGAVVDELRKRGFKHAYVLDEGVFAWEKKGYPVVKAAGQAAIPAPPPGEHLAPGAREGGAAAPTGHEGHGHD